MQILVHTHHAADGSENLNLWVKSKVESRLTNFVRRITRVEVYLTDMNSDKKGVDKRCTIEAKLQGLQTLAASSDGPTAAQALTGAIDKIEKVVDRHVKKLAHHKGHSPMGGVPFAATGNDDADFDDSVSPEESPVEVS